MKVDELLEKLKAAQVEIWLDDQLLRFRAPEGQFDVALLAQLRRHKSAIVAHLQETTSKNRAKRRVEPMSVGQEALYFLHTLAPRSPAYNVASAARILSPVDVGAMQRALEQLGSRHEMLRATFELRDGQPTCRVAGHVALDFRQLMLPDADPCTLHDAVREEYRQPFNLTEGPLFRTRLFTIAPQQHVLLFTLHHIMFDFWSLWLVHDEFSRLYTQETTQTTALLPSSSVSYFDFVRTQQELLASERGEQLWAYWRDRLTGDVAPIELPCDVRRADRANLLGSTHHFRIPDQLSNQLRQLAARHGATPFMILLSLFKVLLHRHSGQRDLIVGTTTSGRSADFTQVVGYFVNTLAIRTHIDEDASFLEYLGEVKERTLEAIEHQDYPFPTLVDRLNPRRDRDRQPICNVMFGLQKPQTFSEVQGLLQTEDCTLQWGDLKIQHYEMNQQEGQFDLTLELFDTGQSFLGALKYNDDLFARDSVVRFADHFINLAQSAVDNPNCQPADFEILGSDERQKLLALAGDGEVVLPVDCRMHRLFEQTTQRVPNAIAASADDGTLSYDQLNRKANQLARLLQREGVRPGTRVACCLSRGLDIPIALLAILKAGGTYVPIDNANPSERTAQIVGQCGDDAIMLRSQFADDLDLEVGSSLNDVPSTLVVLDRIRDESQGLDDSDLSLDFPHATPAYAVFTSGSTGQPKGVTVSHRSIVEHIVSIRDTFGLLEEDRVLQFSNLGFDPSLEQMLAPWSLGAAVVIRGEQLMAPAQFWHYVAEQKLTVVNVPPAYFRECSIELARTTPELDTLRLLIIGGDQFPTDAIEVWADYDVRILNAYGPTEAVITATVFDVSAHTTLACVPIGRPKPGMRAYVLDDEGGLCPFGASGELHLAGTMLADAYLGDGDLTAAKFLADPFSDQPESRMYRTGDRVRWSSDGNLEFLGRHDQQIKVNGCRVEAGEIENTLVTSQSVRQCHVQLHPDSQGECKLIAWVVPAEGVETTQEELRDFLKGRLPSYMVPRQFVLLQELPTGVSGKVDSRALPAPEAARPATQEFAPARNDIERFLADLWSDTLGVPTIGIYDSFFDLGGGSLTSLRIASRAAEAGLVADGKPIQPDLLFRFPTIAELAANLERCESR